VYNILGYKSRFLSRRGINPVKTVKVAFYFMVWTDEFEGYFRTDPGGTNTGADGYDPDVFYD
jgi:hypothetical protein